MFSECHCLGFLYIYLQSTSCYCHARSLSVSSCGWCGDSATKSISPAKRRLFNISLFSITPALTEFSDHFITASRKWLNRSGTNPHTCLTPTYSVSYSSTMTIDFLHTCRSSSSIVSSSGIPQFFSTCPNLWNACLKSKKLL